MPVCLVYALTPKWLLNFNKNAKPQASQIPFGLTLYLYYKTWTDVEKHPENCNTSQGVNTFLCLQYKLLRIFQMYLMFPAFSVSLCFLLWSGFMLFGSRTLFFVATFWINMISAQSQTDLIWPKMWTGCGTLPPGEVSLQSRDLVRSSPWDCSAANERGRKVFQGCSHASLEVLVSSVALWLHSHWFRPYLGLSFSSLAPEGNEWRWNTFYF